MNKTYLIFRHEFLHTVKRIGYFALTFTVPLLGLLGIGFMELVKEKPGTGNQEMQQLGFVDESGMVDPELPPGYEWLVRYDSEETAVQALLDGAVPDFFVISEDYLTSGAVRRYTLAKELVTPPATAGAIKYFLTTMLLGDSVPQARIELVRSPLNLSVTRLDETGAPALEQSNVGNIIVPAVFSLLLGFAFIFGASALISGLGEEKESRLVEVLFSSVSIRQLLVGKILALGTAGLLQVLVWLISAPLLLNLASDRFGGFMSEIQIPGNFLLIGIVYFVLGYLLFAVMSVCVGAVSPNVREANQISMFYLMASFVPLWFSSLLFAFPDSPLWVVLTIFPLTAPVQTILRLGVMEVPAWQIAASLGTLTVSVALCLVLAIRLFRIYMLMYGNRPRLSEVVRSLRSA